MLVFFLTIFGFSKEALAGTYWVSPEGSASWFECQRPEDPGSGYCSLPTANVNAKAGDVVQMKEGVYSKLTGMGLISPANSGTPGNPIVFQSAPGELAVLTNNSDSSRGAIHMQGKFHIKITGIKVLDSYAFFYKTRSHLRNHRVAQA